MSKLLLPEPLSGEPAEGGSGGGATVGSGAGEAVGARVGETVGSGVGGTVGSGVGEAVGSGVGEAVGFGVGEALGFGVGEAVGFGVTSGSGVEVSADIATYEDSLYDLASLVTGSSMVMPNPMKLDKNTKADTPDIIKCFFGDCFLTSFIIVSNINTGMHIRLIRTKNARTVFIEYPLFL